MNIQFDVDAVHLPDDTAAVDHVADDDDPADKAAVDRMSLVDAVAYAAVDDTVKLKQCTYNYYLFSCSSSRT